LDFNSEDLYQTSIEVKNKDCKVLKELKKANVKDFQVADIRSLSKESVRHLIKAPLDRINLNSEEISVHLKNRSKNDVDQGVWIDSKGCSVCKTILLSGALLISGSSVESESISYRFVSPNFEVNKTIISQLEDLGLEIKINTLGKYRPNGKLLTKRQERVLWLTYKMGFFDCPRKSDTIEISKVLGISPSTLSEITRRGVGRLIENYFED